jgi:hypothetical protein
MQVAAGWIAAQRPAATRVLLPGRQAQRQFEQHRQRIAFERGGSWPFTPAHGLERARHGIGPQRQFDSRRSAETAKRIGLVGPVEAARTGRVTVQVVLAGLMVGDGSFHWIAIRRLGVHQ